MSAKRPLNYLQEPWVRSYSHASVSATTTVKLFTVPAGKKLHIDRVWYNNPTGLTGASGNAFKGEIKDGSTVMATLFNTDTGAGGATLAADTPAQVSVAASVAVASATDVITLVLTKTGTATLPIGDLFIEGRYV